MFLGVAGVLAAACVVQGTSDDELFRRAERLRKEDRPAETLSEFKVLLERRSDHLEGHVG